MDIERRVARLVDMEVNIASTRLNTRVLILSVEVKGFVPSPREFSEKVVARVSECLAGSAETAEVRLVLDLRRIFFVAEATVFPLIAQYAPWLVTRFSRMCIVMPPAERVKACLQEAWVKWTSETTRQYYANCALPLVRVVHRARDVKHFIEGNVLDAIQT